MKMLAEHDRHDLAITCAVCATNLRPEMVPAEQHAIGCPVRGQLRTLELHATGVRGCRAAWQQNNPRG